ncbi:protein ABHD8-like isoform X2 [Dysidea avara]|uniref:protein ABHD8-like isoform X2 n=1 Tax=Dysidea avara TaxID=196820 RepID=UPI0033167C6E
MLYEDVEVRPGRTLRLYYRKVSDGSSPSRSDTIILFLHGVGGCALLWEKQMDYLFDQGYDVYAPDFYGHGDSQHPGELEQKHYTFIELREDILALFDWINPTACVIVSHSYGASFSHYLCKERESQVTQLVEISGSHPRPLKTHCCSIYRLPVCCFNTCGDYLRRGFMALAFSQPAPADAAPAYNLTPEMFKYVMRGQVWREHTREYCACITQPTLLIVGSQDNFVSLSEVQETEEEQDW